MSELTEDVIEILNDAMSRLEKAPAPTRETAIALERMAEATMWLARDGIHEHLSPDLRRARMAPVPEGDSG